MSTFIGLATELLKISPFIKAALRRLPIFPNLTKEERSRTVFGFFRPLNDPLDFQHPEVGSNNILYFMVLFVYTAMAPLVNWFLAFCFVLMNSAYRYAVRSATGYFTRLLVECYSPRSHFLCSLSFSATIRQHLIVEV